MTDTNFINECKKGAYHNRLGKINVETSKKISSNEITIENAKSIDNLKVNGYSKQKIYTGKNLLNVPCDYTITGVKQIDIDLPAGIYIANWESIMTDGKYTDMLLYFYYEDGTNYSRYISPTYESKRLIFELTKKVNKIGIYSQNNWNNSQGVTTSFKDLMISIDGGEYEPYVGGQSAPNKDYPQDIEVVKGNVLVKSTSPETNEESEIIYNLGDNFMAEGDYIKDNILYKNTRHLRLAIKDMNNAEDYPGWKQVQQLYDDYPNFNGRLSVKCKYKSNISNASDAFAINTNSNNKILYLGKSIWGLTQSEWKEQYPDLVIDLYYEIPETEEIQLNKTGELKLFEPTTIITNNFNSEMEVKFVDYSTEITNSNNLSSFTVEDGCYVDGNIVGTTYMKKLTAQFVSVPQDVDLIDKTIHAKIGVKYADLSKEWLNMGKYTVERPKDEQTADLTQITTYDDFNKLDKPYICNLNFENDVTIGDYYIDVCNQLELTPKTATFINSDIPVTANPFVNNETLRFVLQEIEKTACSFSEIDFGTNEIDLVWLNQNEEPDYEFETSDYSTLEGGKIVYGPVNSLVLKYSQIEGENATIEDEESIATNGETQLAIEDSYFLFTEDLKWQAINKIWERVKGLTYTDCKLTSYYGKPFLKVGQKIRVHTNDGRVFDTYVLKHTFTYDGTFQSIIESPVLTKQETKIKNKSISEAIRITEIKVDKANGQITATTKKTQELEDNLNNNYYSKTNVNELIQTAETGVTNTFSEAGGNNVFRNTGLWFAESTTKEVIVTDNLYNNVEYTYTEYNDPFINVTSTLDSKFPATTNSSDVVRMTNNSLIPIKEDGEYKLITPDLSGIENYGYGLYMTEFDSEFKPVVYMSNPETLYVHAYKVSNDEEPLELHKDTRYLLFYVMQDEGELTIPLDVVTETLSSMQVIETAKETVKEEGYEFWDGKVIKGSNENAVNNTSMLLQSGSLSQEQDVPNGNYSVSFYYQKLNPFAEASVVINDKEYSLDSEEIKQFYTGEKDDESGEYITQPIIVTSNHIKIEFKCNVNNGVEIWDLMCNKGTVKLAWSQNQNETTTETVNISKGITITSTNIEAIFKANANGIKILTLQGATVAYFTDKGLSTKELIIENKAQICGTLVQEVDGQTWFTRM